MFGFIVLLTALGLGAGAAGFAIVGIMALFSGAKVAAFIMGALIESGKVVSVSWVYRNWNEKTKLKYALLPLIAVSMMLTSMGIFGFLSKAHIEQAAPINNNKAQIQRLDERIVRERKKIKDAQGIIDQLDQNINVLIKYDRISGPNGSRAVRKKQQPQRKALEQTIDTAETKINEYQDKEFSLNKDLRAQEINVGPVKYIAALIYTHPKKELEKAVRIVILAFIFVFDPLAILLLMAANRTLMLQKQNGPSKRARKLAARLTEGRVRANIKKIDPTDNTRPTVGPPAPKPSTQNKPMPSRTGKFAEPPK